MHRGAKRPGILSGDLPATAPLGLRLGAAVIDAAIVAALAVVVGLCIRLIVILLPERVGAAEGFLILAMTLPIGGAYFVYAWACEGATLGQRTLGLRVVRAGAPAAADRIGFRRALLRLLGLVAGVFVIDLVVAVLRSDRRALHDVVAGSIVVADLEVAIPRFDRSLSPIRKGRKYA